MKRHLYCLSNSVWDADDFLNNRNCNPKGTDLYLFATEAKAEEFAMLLDTDNRICNECDLYDGEVDEAKILELTGFETIDEFDEALKESYSLSCSNFGEDELTAVCSYIIDEYEYTMQNVMCANYDFNKSVEGAVIVVWSWQRYTGYARKCEELRYGQHGETEKMLTKQDRVFVSQCDVVMTKKEVEDCQDLSCELRERLLEKDWKWTNPHFVARMIEERL